MNAYPLLAALGPEPGTVVSLVGAGGKTSLMLAIALEAVARWGPERVLVTTTTHIYEPLPADFPPLGPGVAPPMRVHLARAPAEAVAALRQNDQAGQGEHVLPVLAGGVVTPAAAGERRKLAGIPPGWVDEIARAFPRTLILVEADGAAGRPLKAPADHEPVLPSPPGIVLAVAGADSLGQVIRPDRVHRPERVTRLMGCQTEGTVSPQILATVLWHSEGYGKVRRPGFRLVPVINKVDSAGRLAIARLAAREILAMGAPLVLLTSCLCWPVRVEAVSLSEVLSP